MFVLRLQRHRDQQPDRARHRRGDAEQPDLRGCSAVNIPGVTGVTSVTVNNLSYTNSVGDGSGNPVTLSPGSAGPIQTTIKLRTLLGSVTCTYQANPTSLSGTTDNTAQTISFSNQSFGLSSGPGTCFAAGYFTAAYGPVQDTSQSGSPSVYVN